ncbi:MAG: phage tail tape measure protein [Oliverpabstia sp.]
MAKKTQAQIEFKAVTSEFSSGIKKMNSDIQTVTKELKLNAAQMKGAGETTDLLKQKQQLLSKEYEAAKTKVNLTSKSMEEAKRILGEGSKEYQNLNNRLIEARTQEQNLKNQLDETTKKIISQTQEIQKEVTAEEQFLEATAGISTGIAEMDVALQGSSKQLELNSLKMKETGENAKGLKESQKILETAYDQASAKVILTEQSLDKAKEAYGENSVEVQKMKNALYDAKIQEQDLKNQLDETTKKLKAQYSITGYLSKGFKTAGDHIQGFAGKVKAVGGGIESAGKKLMPLTTGIVGMGVAGSKMALDFEDGIANINTLLDDDSHLEGYKNTVRKLSDDTGMSISTMTDGMYQAISSLGDGGKETEKIFGTMAKSAKAGGAEVADSVSLISAGMKGYGSVNDETAQKISDLAFMTAKLGVTTFPEMAKSMQPLFPLSSSLGISLEELFGTMATGTGVTGNTAEVSTQLKAVLSNLMKPTEAMQGLIEKYGYSNATAMIESEGLSGVLKILQDETGGQSDKMAELFSSTEALTLMTALTGAQFDTFNEKLGQMGDVSGTTEEAMGKLETKGDSIRKTMNLAKNTLMETGTVLMDSLAPVIVDVADGVKNLTEGFSKLNPEQQQTILKIAGIVAIAGPLLIGIGKVTTGISSVIGVAGKLTSGIGGLIGIIGGLSPTFLIVAGVIAIVVAAGVLLYKNWDKIKEFAGNLKDAVVEKWTALKDGIASKTEEIRQGASEKWESIKQATLEKAEEIRSGVKEKYEQVKETMGTVMEAAKSTVDQKLNNIKSAYESHGGGVRGIAAGFMEGVKGYYTSGYTFIDTLTGGKLSNIASQFRNKMGDAKSTVSEKMSAIKDAFSEKIGGARDKVREGIDKIKSFFNFSWSLPKLKLPHFSIDGKFSLNPPSVPKFGISWYAKGALFTKPTIIPANGFGEAGNEYALPLNRTSLAPLANMIGEMVNQKLGAVNVIDYEKIDKIMSKYSKKEYVWKANRRELLRLIAGG